MTSLNYFSLCFMFYLFVLIYYLHMFLSTPVDRLHYCSSSLQTFVVTLFHNFWIFFFQFNCGDVYDACIDLVFYSFIGIISF